MSRALLIATLAMGACASPESLEGRPCPCAGEYSCCAGKCVARGSRCDDRADASPDAAADAPAGAADAQRDNAPPDLATDLSPDLHPDAPLDLPSDVARDLPPDAPPPPRWQALADTGLGEHLELWFDLKIAPDGTPFVAIEKHTPPGRSRVTMVLRYELGAWQQVGDTLPGAETAAFALGPDGTPVIEAFGVIYRFQQGQWKALPEVGQGLAISTASAALAIDGAGRIHTVAFDVMQTGFSVVRFNGTSWEIVARRNASIKRGVPFLRFDSRGPYLAVASSDITGIEPSTTEVWRASGADWLPVGGLLENFLAGAVAVAPDGTAWAISSDESGIDTRRAAVASPWTELEFRPAFTGVSLAAPGADVSTGGVLHVAYLADRDPGPDVVPGPLVVRLEGSKWTELPTAGLDPNVFDSIKLALTRRSGRDVPYIAYSRLNRVVVKTLE
jgi:hypothetical protein